MLRTTAIATVLATAGLGLFTAPALAGPQRFKLTSGTAETKGKARAIGTVRMERQGERVRFVTTGRIDDLCPQDGFGAVLELRYYYNVHDNGYTYADNEVVDDRGCTKAAKKFKAVSTWFGPSKAATLSHVTIEVEEINHDAPLGPDWALQDSVIKKIAFSAFY